MMTPWSTEVEAVAETDGDNLAAGPQCLVRVSLLLTTDPGPMRSFRSFLDFDLDEAHATELLGKLMLALEVVRNRRRPA